MNALNKKNKKAQFNQVMILLLILASAIVLLLFVTKFATRSTMDESINACRLSVMAQSATAFGLVSKTSPLDIGCDKRYVNFYNTKVELGLSLENMNPISVNYGDNKVKRFKELNEFIVDQVIAEELRVCKFQFGEGKIKIFPNDKAGLFLNKEVCFVCSEITFQTGVPQQTFDNIMDYTKKTKFSEQGTSYFDYLSEETVYNNTMWIQGKYYRADPTYQFNIDTSEKYLIYVAKISDTWAKEMIVLDIIPAKNINQQCDLQAS